MPEDPIERITTDLEIYGIPQPEGAPPMTETYLHVRHRPDGSAARAKLGLPAYRGEPGPSGPPGAIHKGERTTAQLGSLASTLSMANVNWSYRNTDTNDQYVWDGDEFIIYADAYGAAGPPGPAPNLSAGFLTIDGEAVENSQFGIRISGLSPNYTVDLDLPAMPKGDKGDTGASGPILDSVDVNQDEEPSDGDVLQYNDGTGKLHWVPGGTYVEEYVVPPSGFPNFQKTLTQSRQLLCTVVIPPKPYPYRLDFSGGVDLEARPGHQIDLEIRSNLGAVSNPETSGPIVGYGKGQNSEGWREVAFRAHSDVAIDPDSEAGVVPPETELTLYVSAVKVAGVLFGWAGRNTKAQLRIRLMRTR